MRVPEWLRTYAALEEAGGLELAPKQLREIARRYEKLLDIVEESLEEAKAEWANVGNHMASRHGKEVQYLQECLAYARAPLEDMSQEGGVA